MAAIYGSAVAGFPLTVIPETAVQADDCLTMPDGQPAPGGHWRYRVDRATNRQCWYVRGDDQEVAPLVSAPTKPVAPPAGAALRPSVANARAEVASDPATIQPDSANGSFTANIVDSENATDVSPMLRPPSTVVTGSRHRPQPRQAAHSSGGSVRTLLSALVGALALVGGASVVVTKFGRKAIGRRKKPGRERTIWQAPPRNDVASPISPVRSSDETSMEWVRMARENQEANRQAEQIEQLLSRAARRSA
jgi:hypothetical protein